MRIGSKTQIWLEIRFFDLKATPQKHHKSPVVHAGDGFLLSDADSSNTRLRRRADCQGFGLPISTVQTSQVSPKHADVIRGLDSVPVGKPSLYTFVAVVFATILVTSAENSGSATRGGTGTQVLWVMHSKTLQSDNSGRLESDSSGRLERGYQKTSCRLPLLSAHRVALFLFAALVMSLVLCFEVGLS